MFCCRHWRAVQCGAGELWATARLLLLPARRLRTKLVSRHHGRAHLLQLFTARSRGGADQINAKRRAVAAASRETMTASRVLIKLNDICASLEQRQRSRQATPTPPLTSSSPRPAAHAPDRQLLSLRAQRAGASQTRSLRTGNCCR